MLVCGDAELRFSKALLVRMGKRAGRNKTELCNHVCLELILSDLTAAGRMLCFTTARRWQ